MPATPLTNDHVNEFRERGYWRSPKLYSDDELASLREAVLAVCGGQKDPGTRYWGHDGPGPLDLRNPKVVQVCNAFWVSARLRQAALDERLGRIGAQLMETRDVRLWHDQAIVKPGVGPDGAGENAGNVGWHQDYAHWQCANTHNFVTAWIALQDTDLTNGGMRTIVGSHTWGLAGDAYTFGEKDLDALEKRFKRDDKAWIDEPCILKAGEVSFHHALTFHGSGPNLSRAPRLCFIVHMMPAECAVAEGGQYHPNLDLLGPDKRPGDRFAGPNFPVIYRRHD